MAVQGKTVWMFKAEALAVQRIHDCQTRLICPMYLPNVLNDIVVEFFCPANEFYRFKCMNDTRWLEFTRDGFGRSGDHFRRYGVPSAIKYERLKCNRWQQWNPLSKSRLVEVESKFRFVFPSAYRDFLVKFHRPTFDESRLRLTDWTTGFDLPLAEADVSNSDKLWNEYELMSMTDRWNVHVQNVGSQVAEIDGHYPVPEWTHYILTEALPCRNEFLRDLLTGYYTFLSSVNQNMVSVPKLIPIANGVNTFYVMSKTATVDCDCVFAFGYEGSHLKLMLVSPNLESFLLQFYNGFSHFQRGFWGPATGFFDFDEAWTPTHPLSASWAPFTQITIPDKLTPDQKSLLTHIPFWGPVLRTTPPRFI